MCCFNMVIVMVGVVLRELLAKAGTEDESVFDFFSRRAGDEVCVSVMFLTPFQTLCSPLKGLSNHVFESVIASSKNICSKNHELIGLV